MLAGVTPTDELPQTYVMEYELILTDTAHPVMLLLLLILAVELATETKVQDAVGRTVIGVSPPLAKGEPVISIIVPLSKE